MNAGPAAFAYVGAFVDELSRAGVRHVVIAPGSRSAPLALTIAEHPALRTWMHLDERSAAFFALGLARGLDEAVALVCTSGSAAANFLPAVVEARRAGVALLVLTADRPPELRDVGAAQTIDQRMLYGTHAKHFVDVALPDVAADLLRYVRTLACRSVALARTPPLGPVHLNFPFREPLVPVALPAPVDLSPADALAWHGRPNGAPWAVVGGSRSRPDDDALDRVAERLRAAERPLIVCGPQYDGTLPSALAALARAAGAPILADPLSQLRWGAHDRQCTIDRYDAALRHEPLAAALSPDVVIRFGSVPTSRPLLDFLRRHGSAWSVAVSDAGWSDPAQMLAATIDAPPTTVCDLLRGRLATLPATPSRDAWLRRWRTVNDVAGRALSRYVASLGDEPFEGRVLAQIAAAIPAEGTLFVSSSMPVRDLDAFAPGDARAIRVLANRGANGIDGVVSTALGVAAASEGHARAPLVLAIGDLAFYHDMNGLLAASLHGLHATIVVINNDGGGIFSFLPQAAAPAHFEQLFGTPHGLSFAPVAALYGARYQHLPEGAPLADALRAGMGASGLHILEVRTERARNVVLHRGAWAAVAEALDAPDEG